ncbi:hypothetical protein [Pseudochelatococcus contaminans]|uniref:Uncharacterized protein n=1 Tax=Pseudochelatococcus contaminans TaxID=1538103 RepID=A0A7W6EF72_9HYPH|nr:hypothetical protein [Pseudochelatococcus contaminans]MBB3808653.1 hypothetical protein [Pseudochelatococcus contaminans]
MASARIPAYTQTLAAAIETANAERCQQVDAIPEIHPMPMPFPGRFQQHNGETVNHALPDVEQREKPLTS